MERVPEMTFSRKRRHSSRQNGSTSQEEEERQPPRSRLRGHGRMASRTSSSSVEIVDVIVPRAQLDTPPQDEPIDLSSVCVVDLTDETDPAFHRSLRSSAQDDVVDLTDVPDTAERAPARRGRRRGRSRASLQRPIAILSDDSDEENDIEVLPEIVICNSYRSEAPRDDEVDGTAEDNGGRHTSPAKRIITCPICMEDERTLQRRGQQLMSTNCGHVFCRPCIRTSINAQRKCPTCRKKLTIRQIHPIFL